MKSKKLSKKELKVATERMGMLVDIEATIIPTMKSKAERIAEDCMKSFHAVRVIVATGKRLPIVCSECKAKIRAIEGEEG